MLARFDDGRSKTRYSIAATILETEDLKIALKQVQKASASLELKDRALVLRSILDEIADREKCILRLRK
jgi:ACT domain-containing protein